MQLTSRKNPLRSRGVIGGLVASGSFGVVAFLLNRIGVPVSVDELKTIQDTGGAVLLNVEAFRETVWPAAIAVGGGALTLIGNVWRRSKIAWSQYDSGKPALESRTVWGGITALVGSVAAVYQAGADVWVTDIEQAQALAEQGRLIVLRSREWWSVIAPSVVALCGVAVGVYGRVVATRKVVG